MAKASKAKKKSSRSAKKKVTKKRQAKKKANKRAAKKAAKKKAVKKSAQKKPAKKKAVKKSAQRKPSKKKVVKKATAKKASKASAASGKGAKKSPVGGSNSKRLAEGQKAPAFDLPNQDGISVSSSELAGSPYVLYFYPKDDTPGCTKEACGFRDDMAEFRNSGVRVIGVSPDSPQSHTKFRSKYDLNFTLLSDEERSLAKAYGSWILKKNYGREYMGVERSTFLVDSQGVIRKAWRGVKVDGHVDAVLGETRALGSA